MSNTITEVPSLSTLGWVTDPGNKADFLLAYFFEAEASQSNLYANNVSSLQYIIQQFGNNVNNVITNIQNTLEIYLGRYYDLATVNVSSDANDTDLSGSCSITIRCKVSEGGTSYDVAKVVSVVNSKIEKIINLNNNG